MTLPASIGRTMALVIITTFATGVAVTMPVHAQSTVTVPRNPALADSPWPTYHANSYAQKSSTLRGPEATDDPEVQFVPLPFGVSPWSQLSERYPDGSRVVWGGTFTHVFKVSVDGAQFELADSYDIRQAGGRTIMGRTLLWNMIILKGNKVIVTDPVARRIHRFADQNPSDPRSPIVLEASWDIPPEIPGAVSQFNISYDGWIIFVSRENYMGAVRPDFTSNTADYRSFKLPIDAREVSTHNGFPIDENGGVYIVATDRMFRIDWKDNQFSIGWQSPYDFRGTEGRDRDGFNSELINTLRGAEGTGSGTTPTLIGHGGEDNLVLVADGHTPNNMVAFWREEPPADWRGIPGYDRQIAAITRLPYSTPEGRGFTAENSPPAFGYDIALAQYNGFFPIRPLTGVQKLRWSPVSRTLDIVWATDAVNMNGVMTYSAGSNLLYSSGRRNGIYHFYAVDWDSGAVALDIPMGRRDDYRDQGNQSTLNDDRSIIFGTSGGIVRIYPR